MNPDLQQQLAELLKKLLGAMESGTAFAADQIPPLVQEKIWLGRFEESVWFGFACVLLLCGVAVTRWMWRKTGEDMKDAREHLSMGDRVFVSAVAAMLLVGIPFSILADQLHDFALVWFAPRLYIVEWLKGLVTS